MCPEIQFSAGISFFFFKIEKGAQVIKLSRLYNLIDDKISSLGFIADTHNEEGLAKNLSGWKLKFRIDSSMPRSFSCDTLTKSSVPRFRYGQLHNPWFCIAHALVTR